MKLLFFIKGDGKWSSERIGNPKSERVDVVTLNEYRVTISIDAYMYA